MDIKILIIIGLVILWILIGFCTYIWNAKRTYCCNFIWSDFLSIVGLGLVSFTVYIFVIFIEDFPKFMERLLKKNNK